MSHLSELLKMPSNLRGNKLSTGVVRVQAVNIQALYMRGYRKSINHVKPARCGRRRDFGPDTIKQITVMLRRLVLRAPQRR